MFCTQYKFVETFFGITVIEILKTLKFNRKKFFLKRVILLIGKTKNASFERFH